MKMKAEDGRMLTARTAARDAAEHRGVLAALLFLKNLPGVGKRTINRYCVRSLQELQAGDSLRTPEGALGEAAALCGEWLGPAGVQPAGRDMEAAESAARRVLSWLDAHPDVRAVTVLDADYPERLRDLGPDRPPVLYVRSAVPAGSANTAPALGTGGFLSAGQSGGMPLQIAVIGSRWPGDRTFREGQEAAETLVRDCGAVILSGLARGCDAIGHRAAIRAGGVTSAVLASGIDIITPAMHTELAGEILKTGGFLLSEYDPGTEAEEFRYVERDRLTAAMSDGILVLECEVRSGTMQTVRAGAELGRPLACLFPAEEGSAPSDGFEPAEGNRYMRDHYHASAIRNRDDLHRFTERIRASRENENAGGSRQDKPGTKQLTFLK